MTIREYSIEILKELENTLRGVDDGVADKMIDEVIGAKRIFVAGAGRSLLMLKGFAMRLMHLGFTAYVVGETVTPAIQKGDLLIVGSGSGETASLVKTAEKAKSLGVRIALVTIFPHSSIGKLADTVLAVNAPTSKADTPFKSIQPGGSCFEQSMLLLYDACILKISEKLGLNANENLKLRHANLE